MTDDPERKDDPIEPVDDGDEPIELDDERAPVEPDAGSAPIELEDETPADGEPCPNCGAPMRRGDDIVCMRCGYDMKSLEVIETRTGTTEAPEEPETAKPLVSPAPGIKLSLIVAAVALAALAAGAMLGVQGLFPRIIADEHTGIVRDPYVAERLMELGRGIVLIGMWALAGTTALMVVASLAARPLGDLRVTVCRVLAMVTVIRLLSFLDVGPRAVELILEIVLQLAAYVGLLISWIGIKRHDALLTTAITLLIIVGLYAISQVVGWAGVA